MWIQSWMDILYWYVPCAFSLLPCPTCPFVTLVPAMFSALALAQQYKPKSFRYDQPFPGRTLVLKWAQTAKLTTRIHPPPWRSGQYHAQLQSDRQTRQEA